MILKAITAGVVLSMAAFSGVLIVTYHEAPVPIITGCWFGINIFLNFLD